ncbi:MAG: hypothetical protein RID42_08945 [Alphaproteobacteria bacterium]
MNSATTTEGAPDGGVGLSALAGATVTCTALDTCVRHYAECLDYRLVSQGVVDEALATLWQAPRQTGRPFAILRPAIGGGDQWVRFVEGPVADTPPFRTFGWNALEISVRDVVDLKQRLEGSVFERLSGPHFLANGTSSIQAMQVLGPAGEVLYLTQIPDEPDKAHLPQARVAVDRLFIAVLGVPDAAAAQDWYASRFDVTRRPPRTAMLRALNQAYGFEETRQHLLASVRLTRQGMIEIDGYPLEARSREARPGYLPGGISSVTVFADQVPPTFADRGVRIDAFPYGGAWVAALQGTAGERLELVCEATP